ncbi:MAG: helix-turn-helix transcriptional regulator [Clostridia bacterium]|nr:helix-turn-helix transcriptional regulator [Clostridia bacterium]
MIADVLRKARNNVGVSQREMAELLNIDRPTYNKIEQNKIAPRYEDLPKIAKNLKIDLKLLQKSICARPKIACAHPPKRKTSINTYKLTVALDRGDFCELTKSNLKKCGYNNLSEFILVAYSQLEKQLKELDSK